MLHGVNLTLCISIAVAIVWLTEGSPVFGFAYLFTAVILWLKLVSYAHANRDLRLAWRALAGAAKGKGGGEPGGSGEAWRGGGGWSIGGFDEGGGRQVRVVIRG